MKFKTIFIVFNAVVVLSFLSIFLVPLFVLGGEYFAFFASRNWIAALLFLAAFLAANAYFLLNWRLFGLLEREDWPALVRHLEEQIYRKGRLRGTNIRLLANAYLLTSAVEEIHRLEAHLGKSRPDLLDRQPLPFGIPYLLKSPPEEAEQYFARQVARPLLRQKEWMRWNHAFTLLQTRQTDAARAELLGLLDSLAGREPLLGLLTLYLLDSFSQSDESVGERVERERLELSRRYSRPRLERIVERSRGNLEVLILSRLVQDALRWLYRSAAGSAPGGEPASPPPPPSPAQGSGPPAGSR